MAKDYYARLGVPRGAAEADIKKAYSKLEMEFHPDRPAHERDKEKAEVRFKEITEAYEVLRDADKRAAYDRYGEAGLRGAGGGGGDSPFDLSEALNVFMRDFGGLGGVQSVFRGGQPSPPHRRPRQDLNAHLGPP